MYQPSENEELFKIKPIGVRYKCPFCNEGEMIVTNDPVDMPLVHYIGEAPPIMRKHRCNKCSKEMKLPKSYPYIEWIKNEYKEE